MIYLIRFILCVIILSILIFSIICIRVGSVNLALRYCDGERLFFTPENTNLGHCKPNQSHTVEVSVFNCSNNDLTLHGYNSSCDCVQLNDINIKIASWSKKRLSFTIDTGNYVGSRNQTVQLYLGEDNLISLSSVFSWDVDAPVAITE